MTTTRISKSQFKTLLRECLADLIEEGAFDKKIKQIVESRSPGLSSDGVAASVLREQSDKSNNTNGSSVEAESSGTENINPALLAAVNNVASGMSSQNQSMFKSLMLETAMTTLQKQIAGETSIPTNGVMGLLNNGPATPMSVVAEKKQLANLAGGDISRWAKTAFGKIPKTQPKK